MSKKFFYILSAIVLSGCVAAIILYYLPDFHYAADTTLDFLIADTLIRVFAAAFLVLLLLYDGKKRYFAVSPRAFLKRLIFVLPCIAVAVVNFPFSAIISGSATVTKTNLLPLFIVHCVMIAVVEECFFRGIVQPLVYRFFKGRKFDVIITVLITSAVFALWHLMNLLSGAGVGDTLLQVVYTFLLGCMFSFIFILTKNLWWCVFTHALFDVGGRIITTLGSGAFQDVTFWVLTVAVGTVVGIYVFLMLLRMQKTGLRTSDQAVDNEQ